MDQDMLNWNPFGNAEPFPGETLVADGWVYKDFNPMLTEFWEFMLGLFGEGNYRLVTMSVQTRDEQEYRRGQMFVAPAGLERVKAYRDSGKSYPDPFDPMPTL